MIYIDSCVPMYLVGGDHPLKAKTISLISSLAQSGQTLVTSAEAFQEILHRYRALQDPIHMEAAYSSLEEMADQVFAIEKNDVDEAKSFIHRFPKLSSRDCLHLAVMKRRKIESIWTYDTGFDQVPGVTRIGA